MKVLLLINSPPSSGFNLKDSLDAALTTAVFGQQVSLLFMGAGVAHLQQAAENGIEELQDYGIEKLYAQTHALEAHQLHPASLNPPPRCLNDQEIAVLLASQHTVLHF